MCVSCLRHKEVKHKRLKFSRTLRNKLNYIKADCPISDTHICGFFFWLEQNTENSLGFKKKQNRIQFFKNPVGVFPFDDFSIISLSLLVIQNKINETVERTILNISEVKGAT